MAAPTTELLADIDGPIARLTLNRPEKANALSPSLLDALEDAVARAAATPAVRVVVISGAGKGFSGGYDLEAAGDGPAGVVEDVERLRALTQRWLRIWDAPVPTIAQVHGYCLAGGLELMLGCDLAVCAEDTRVGFPAVRAQGVPPIMAYPWLMPMRHAKLLLWSGDVLTGAEAAELGLVNASVPAADVTAETDRVARRIARSPRELLILSKRALHRAYDAMGLRTGVAAGLEYDAIAHMTEPARRFREVARESGVAAALQWRDQHYAGD